MYVYDMDCSPQTAVNSVAVIFMSVASVVLIIILFFIFFKRIRKVHFLLLLSIETILS